MKHLRHIAPLVLLLAVQAADAADGGSDYKVTILKPAPLNAAVLQDTKVAGKSIADMFGPVSEVRVQMMSGGNKTAIDGDVKKVEQHIRGRLNAARCLGRDADVPYHKAPWVHAHLLLKDGRILPMEILLSGIIIGDLIFDGVPKSGPSQ